MCPPNPHVLPNHVVGYVRYRPLGKSHFVEAPWADPNRPPDAYLPSAMTLKALSISKKYSLMPLRSYSERQLAYCENELHKIFGKFLQGDNFLPIDQIRHRINWRSSPGYPFYYECNNNSDAMARYGDLIHAQYYAMLGGQRLWMPFTVTLKDELRTAEKVKAESTRGFDATTLSFNYLCKSLFSLQNEKIMEHCGEHPITIGVSLPGPQFVNITLALGNNPKEQAPSTYGGDGKHWDHTVNLSLARSVREFRKRYQRPELRDVINYVYDTVYAGHRIALGVVYYILHQCSGWENTAHDNSLILLEALIDAFHELTGLDWKHYLKINTNGDDFRHRHVGDLTCLDGDKFTSDKMARYLLQYGIEVEYETKIPVFCYEATYLSHHLRLRYVSQIGDIMVAAGNYEKLKSSLNWVQTSSDVPFEESVLLHLLGLRICFWPWAIDFLDVEEKIDNYLDYLKKNHKMTPQLWDLLSARIPESSILGIHTRLEQTLPVKFYTVLFYVYEMFGFNFFPTLNYSVALNYQQNNYSLESKHYAMQASTTIKTSSGAKSRNGPNRAQRRAQSRRDKAAARNGSKNGGAVVKANTNGFRSSVNRSISIIGNTSRKVAAPAAISSENRFGFSIGRGRYRDSVRIHAKEWIGPVVTPTTVTPGLTLLEFYLNPAEFGGGRLALFSQLYEKFLFKKFVVHFAPSVSSQTPGSLILAYDRDINDPTPPPNQQGVRTFLAFEDSSSGNVWTPRTMACKLEAPETGYYTNTANSQDDRLTYQGQLYVAVMENPPPNTTLGDLILEYDCELFIPQLEGGSKMVVTNDASKAGVTPSATDFIKNIQTVSTAPISAGAGSFVPKSDASGYYFDLAEGLYRMAASAAGTLAATQSILPLTATIVAKTPAPAPAPQPILSVINNPGTTATTASSVQNLFYDALLAIPRGGGKVYLQGTNLDLIMAAGGATTMGINLVKVGPYADPGGYYVS